MSYQREVSENTKRIFTDLLFGNQLKDYRIESGATPTENKEYKDALYKYNIILDYVKDLETNTVLKEVLEGKKEFHEDYYDNKTLTPEQANEHYKIDKFYNTLKASLVGFTTNGRDLDLNDVDDFELLENSINDIYRSILNKLKRKK